jgi:hypothetical protein
VHLTPSPTTAPETNTSGGRSLDGVSALKAGRLSKHLRQLFTARIAGTRLEMVPPKLRCLPEYHRCTVAPRLVPRRCEDHRCRPHMPLRRRPGQAVLPVFTQRYSGKQQTVFDRGRNILSGETYDDLQLSGLRLAVIKYPSGPLPWRWSPCPRLSWPHLCRATLNPSRRLGACDDQGCSSS